MIWDSNSHGKNADEFFARKKTQVQIFTLMWCFEWDVVRKLATVNPIVLLTIF